MGRATKEWGVKRKDDLLVGESSAKLDCDAFGFYLAKRKEQEGILLNSYLRKHYCIGTKAACAFA